MATNAVTRRLAFNTMSPQPVGAERPVDPDGHLGGSALHAPHHFRATDASDQPHVGRSRVGGHPGSELGR
eukprot:4718858-Pleurochrysis_carterae.AAC.1